MTKEEHVMYLLATKKVPLDVLKEAAKGVKHIKKKDVPEYARQKLQEYLDGVVGKIKRKRE